MYHSSLSSCHGSSNFSSDLLIASSVDLLEFTTLLFSQFLLSNLSNLGRNSSISKSIGNYNSHLFPGLRLALSLLATNSPHDHHKLFKSLETSTQENLWIFEHAERQEFIHLDCLLHIMGQRHQIKPNTRQVQRLIYISSLVLQDSTKCSHGVITCMMILGQLALLCLCGVVKGILDCTLDCLKTTIAKWWECSSSMLSSHTDSVNSCLSNS